VNNELERMWKELAAACEVICDSFTSKKLKKNHIQENLCLNGWPPDTVVYNVTSIYVS
jgi:hypothetical protein